MKKFRKRNIKIDPATIDFKVDWRNGVRLEIIPENAEWRNGEHDRKFTILLNDEFAAAMLLSRAREALSHYFKKAKERVEWIEKELKG